MMRPLAGLLVIFLSAVASSTSEAHPFAVTVAEVEYNAKDHQFEVAIRLYPEQLEQALSKEAGHLVSLDRTADIDKLIVRYIEKHFTIRSANSVTKEVREKKSEAVIPVRWVGKEVTVKSVWLYFAIPAQGSLDGLVISNSILMTINPEQQNTVHFTDNHRVASCTLTRDNVEALVRWRTRSKSDSQSRENGLKF